MRLIHGDDDDICEDQSTQSGLGRDLVRKDHRSKLLIIYRTLSIGDAAEEGVLAGLFLLQETNLNLE